MKSLALRLVAGSAAFALAGCQPAAEEAPVDETVSEPMEAEPTDEAVAPEATGEAMEGEEANPEDDGLDGTSSPINPDAAE
ncbi:hypothetical protein K3172_05275 [Qipengyuania sp. 6B39]|uniref:hypothetical protein n=1 Tax=Qipengyuania proteolytica TaxID=2867239 RepID=UPI001C8A406C|nr:hypothetical protein [Qipengyuania proteolytica]MBX7495262.1 hypothetical protein [Qipengyuania proteolytica]